MLPHIILAIISIIAWIVSTKLVIENNMHFGAYLLNILWSIFNFLGALISLKVAYQKPIFRISERIPVNDNIKVKIYNKKNNLIVGKLLDISGKGIGILLNENSTLEVKDTVKINLLNHNFSCTICRINKNILGLEFKSITPDEMKLIMSIFTENMQPHYDNKKIQNYIITDNKESICA